MQQCREQGEDESERKTGLLIFRESEEEISLGRKKSRETAQRRRQTRVKHSEWWKKSLYTREQKERRHSLITKTSAAKRMKTRKVTQTISRKTAAMTVVDKEKEYKKHGDAPKSSEECTEKKPHMKNKR